MWTSCGLKCVCCPPFIVRARPGARWIHRSLGVLIRWEYFGQSLHFCSTFFFFSFQISCQLFFVFLCARQPNLVSASNLVKGTLWSFWSVVLRPGPVFFCPPHPENPLAHVSFWSSSIQTDFSGSRLFSGGCRHKTHIWKALSHQRHSQRL